MRFFARALQRAVASCAAVALFLPSIAADAAVPAAASGDLTSTQKTIPSTTAGTIRVGGHAVTVQPGQLLTPAESFALDQVLHSGKQALLLGINGNAVRGTLDITGVDTSGLNNLVIPRGVRVLDNISQTQLNLSGNLLNSGSLYLYSTGASSPTAFLNANDIINKSGGLMTSIVPATLLGGQSALGRLNLDFNALNNLLNFGTISSSGSINLTAGNLLNNAGTITTNAAAANIALNANSIINSGLVNTALGNININGINAGNLAINNANGILQALKGNINIRDAAFSGKFDTSLIGGDVLSKVLNINSGTGLATVDVRKLTGVLNINADCAHVMAQTKNLQLGTMNLTGDPTFFNPNGSITINSTITVPTGVLAIVASGDILSSLTTGPSIVVQNGDVTLVSGAKFTTNPPGAAGTGTTAPGAGCDSATTLIITGGSTTGGKISFVGKTTGLTAIDTHSTSGDGGDVTLIAYKGTASGSGTIALGTPGSLLANPTGADIDASGFGTGANGNILVVAGSTSTTTNAIYLGNIISTGGTGGGGNVTIAAATPAIVGNTHVDIQDGTVKNTGGTFGVGALTAGTIIQNGTSGFFGINNSGNTNISTKGAVSVQNITSNGTGGINIQSGGNMILNGAIVASSTANDTGNIVLNSSGGLVAYGRNIISKHGDVTIHGANGIQGLNQDIKDITVNGGLTSNNFLLGAIVNKTNNRLYVPDYVNGSIVVIDIDPTSLNFNKQIGTVSGLSAPEGTALSSDGTRLYVAESGNGKIAVLDTSTSIPTVIKHISDPSLHKVEAVALSKDGSTLYVVNNATGATFNTPATASLSVITNLGSPTPTVTTTALPGGATATSQTGGVVVNAQGTLMAISASGTKQVFIYDVRTPGNPQLVKTVAMNDSRFLKEAPIFIATDPNGTRIYVAEGFSNNPLVSNQVPQPPGTIPPSKALTQGSIGVIDFVETSASFGKVLSVASLPATSAPGVASFPQGISVNPTGTELYAQTTYLYSQGVPGYVTSTYTGISQTIEYIPSGRAPDGYGSSAFTTVITENGVPQVYAYSSNTMNLTAPNTVSAITKPTIQAGSGGTHTIDLSTTNGNILVNYDVQGGTFKANAGGLGAVMANSLGPAASTVTDSSADKNLFQIGSIGSITVTGTGINSIRPILQTVGSSTINVNAHVGAVGGTVDIQTYDGNITQNANGLVIGTKVNLFTHLGNIEGATVPVSFTQNVVSSDPNDSSAPSLPPPASLASNVGPIRVSSVVLNGTPKTAGVDYVYDTENSILSWMGINSLVTPGTATASVQVDEKIPFQVSGASSLSVLSSGDAYVNNLTTGTLTLNGASSGGMLQVSSSKAITIPTSAPVRTPTADIRALNGALTVGSPIGLATTSGNNLLLMAGGTGSITQTNKNVVDFIGDSIRLVGGGSVGSSTSNLVIDANTLSADAFATSGSVYLKSLSSTDLTVTGGSSGKNFQLTTPGNLNVTGPITFSSNIILSATGPGSNIDIGGAIGFDGDNIFSKGGTVALTANGSITDVTDNGLVRGNKVTLTATNGSIGSNAHKFLTSGVNLTANAAQGDVYLTLKNSNAFGYYVVNLNGTAKNTGSGTFSAETQEDLGPFSTNPESDIRAFNIAAKNVILKTGPDTRGAIAIAGKVGIAGGTATFMMDEVTKNPTTIGDAMLNQGGTIMASTVNISSVSGNIGTSAKAIAITPGADVQVTAGDANFVGQSNAFLSSTGGLNIHDSTAGNTLQVVTKGTLDVSNNITANKIVLTTAGNFGITQSGGTITGNSSVALTSGGNDLGTSAPLGALKVAGGTLTAKTSGLGSIYINPTGAINLGNITAGTAKTTVPGSGEIAIGDGTSANNWTVVGQIKGSDVNIKLDGDLLRDVPLQGAPLGKIMAKTAVLEAANVGTPAAPFNIVNAQFTLNPTVNNGYVNYSGTPLKLPGQSVLGLFSLKSSAPIVLDAPIIAPDISITTTGTASITTINPGTKQLQGSNSVALTTGTGSIGAGGAAVGIETPLFLLGGKGKVTVQDFYTNDTTITGTGFTGPSLTFDSAVSVGPTKTLAIANGALNSQNVSIHTFGGNIIANSDVGKIGGNVLIDTAGTGSILPGSGKFIGTNVNLRTGGGQIGTNASTRTLTQATNLTLSTSTGNDVFLANSGAVTLKTVDATLVSGKTFDLIASGNVAVNSSIGYSKVTISSSGNGSILTAPSAPITIGDGTDDVTLSASGTGNIAGNAKTTIAGKDVFLNAVNGSIGTASVPVKVSALVGGTFTTGGPVVNISNTVPTLGTTFTLGGTAGGASSSGGSFTLTDDSQKLIVAGPVSTTGPTSSKLGNIKLVEKTGDIQIDKAITANGGSMLIQALNSKAALTVNTGGNLSTSVTSTTATKPAGTISLIVGTTTTATTTVPNGSTFGVGGNITAHWIGTGKVFAANKGLGIVGPVTGAANVTAENANVILNAGAGNITIGDTVDIHADPIITAAPSAVAKNVQPETMAAGSEAIEATHGVAIATSNIASVSPSTNTIVGAMHGIARASQFAGNAMIGPTGINDAAGATPCVAQDTNNAFVLDTAGSVLSPAKDMVVQTGMGALTIKGGASVLVVSDRELGVSIYDLHDNHTGDVSLNVGGQNIVLGPGRHVSVAPSSVDEFADVNPFAAVAHRKLNTVKAGGYQVFTSEFSIPSALKSVNALVRLTRSTASIDRKLVDQMLRNAAITMQINGSAGAYQRQPSHRPQSKMAFAE